MNDTFNMAAYGGEGWVPRLRSHKAEIGCVWASCGVENEWSVLRAVLMHRPGNELLAAGSSPNSTQMLEAIDIGRAQEEHDQIVQCYGDNGVAVHMLDPAEEPPPNQMFCADLFSMTPQGAVLARPASTVRSGEERMVARRLADMGIPILKTFTGHATFEGADLIWLNREQALLGQGLRTNREAFTQISQLFTELGIDTIPVDMPYGTMHLMGMLRIVDKDLAIAWPRRTPHAAIVALRETGYKVVFLPESDEAKSNRALNFVTLGPRRIIMVDNNPDSLMFYESNAIDCLVSPASELVKAAGAIGCLTGILMRDMGI